MDFLLNFISFNLMLRWCVPYGSYGDDKPPLSTSKVSADTQSHDLFFWQLSIVPPVSFHLFCWWFSHVFHQPLITDQWSSIIIYLRKARCKHPHMLIHFAHFLHVPHVFFLQNGAFPKVLPPFCLGGQRCEGPYGNHRILSTRGRLHEVPWLRSSLVGW